MSNPVKLNNNTLFPASVLIAALSVFGGSCWWMSALYARVAQAENSVSDLQTSHKEVVTELKIINENLIEIKTVLKGVR